MPAGRTDCPATTHDTDGPDGTMSDDATPDTLSGDFTPTYDDYDEVELMEQAQGNAQAVIIATVAWLQARGVPLDGWAAGIGQRFSAAWGDPEPWPANEFLDAMLTNLRSLGAVVEWADLADPTVAAATLSNLFIGEHCALFGTDRPHALAYLDATREIAAPRGLVWEWRADGDDVQVKVRAEGTDTTGDGDSAPVR